MQANHSVTRGTGKNRTPQHMTTQDQPQDRTTPDQPQNTFILNQTGENGVMQGILGNSESFGLHVGGMSPGILNDVCGGYTEVEQVLDYWMMGLDHINKINKTEDVSQDFSHEVQNNLASQEPPPVKRDTKMLTHQLKFGLTKPEHVKLDLDLKQLLHSTPVENFNILGAPHIGMESRELKCEPQDIKGENVFWSEGVGLPQEQFDVWRNSLKKGDFQRASNKDVKPDCLDSKKLFKAMPVENHHTPQVKVESQELKCEPQDIKGEDAFWSEGVGLPQEQFDVWRNSLKKGDFQHASNKDVKPDCLDSKKLFKAMPVENHHTPQVKVESQEFKCEPQDIKGEDAFWSEGVGLPHDQFDVWRDSLKEEVRQHIIDKGVKLNCADSKVFLECLPLGNGTPQLKMEGRELKCEPQNTSGEDLIWSKGVGSSQDQFYASLKCDVHQLVIDKYAKLDYLKKPIPLENHSILCIPQIKIEHGKINCEPQDRKEGEVMSEVLGNMKNEWQELNTFKIKAEGENIHESGKVFVKTQIKLESCQMDVDHQHLLRNLEKDVKHSTSTGLRNEVQNAFHVKNESEVSAKHLGVKKELNSLKEEICTNGWPGGKVPLDPIWASWNLQTEIGNTGQICNDQISFRENVPQCSKTKDFKTELCLKDEDPALAFQCSRTKKVMTRDASHLKSPSSSNSQTIHELHNLLTKYGPPRVPKLLVESDVSYQCQSQKTTSGSQHKARVPVQQIISSRFSRQWTAVVPSVRIATQSNPMLNQNEAAKQPPAQQSSNNKHLSLPIKSSSRIAEEVKQLSFCKLCGEKQILHLKKVEQNDETGLKPKCSQSAEQQFWKCCSCKLVFKTRGRLTFHQHRHLTKPIRKCPECDRVFGSLPNLKSHLEVHIQGKSISCKLCDKTFCSEKKLKCHHLRCHTPKTIACDKCEATFSTKASLWYHKATHIKSDDRPFECSECESKFKKKGHLKNHMLIHTGEKPFPCLQCPSKFRLKAHLTAHMERHLRSGSNSGPLKKPGSKRNRRKQELSDTETSEEVSATDEESASPTDSDTSDTEG